MSSEWREVRLGDVADTLLGKTLPRGEGRTEGGNSYLRNVNVQWGHVDMSNLNTMNFSSSEQEKYSLLEGDVLVCEGGEVGRCSLLRQDLPGVFFQNAIHRVRAHEGVHSGFLALSLESLVRGGGLEGVTSKVTIAHLNQVKLRNLPISLPPLHEQRRIVDLIGAVDDAIEAAEELKAGIEQFYRQLSRSLLVKEGALTSVKDMVSVAKAGGTPSRKKPELYMGDIPWLKSGEVNNHAIIRTEECISEQALSESSAWTAPAGAVVVAMYGATAAQVGRLAAPASMNQAVLALVADETKVRADYLFHLLRGFSEDLKRLATGAAQPNLSKEVVIRQELPLPELSEQSDIAECLNEVLETLFHCASERSALRILRSELLSTLLSGVHAIPETYDELLGV